MLCSLVLILSFKIIKGGECHCSFDGNERIGALNFFILNLKFKMVKFRIKVILKTRHVVLMFSCFDKHFDVDMGVWACMLMYFW